VALGHLTAVRALSKPLGTSVHVVPESAVRRIRPPSPTSTHVEAPAQAIASMSLLDGNHVLPPSAVLKNVFVAPHEPDGRNLAGHGVAPEAAPTA